MKTAFALIIGLTSCMTVQAGIVTDGSPRQHEESSWASDAAYFVRAMQRQAPKVLKFDSPLPATAGNKAISERFSAHLPNRPSAIARAWKKGMIEEGVDASRNVLIDCQNANSVVLTTPFMRADSQQNHCFRF